MPCGVPLRKLGSRDLTRSCSHLCLRLRTSRPFNVTLQLIYLIRGGAPLLKLCDARRINLYPVGIEPRTKVPHATLRG
jgi:hypothetical protein